MKKILAIALCLPLVTLVACGKNETNGATELAPAPRPVPAKPATDKPATKPAPGPADAPKPKAPEELKAKPPQASKPEVLPAPKPVNPVPPELEKGVPFPPKRPF